MSTWWRVGRASAANAFADLVVIYTPASWVFGWLVRVLAQVAFYALIGTLLESPAQQRFLLVGGAVTVMVTEVLLVCASTAWERQAGTLPLLVVAPVSMVPVFLGRSVQWIPSALATSSIALFALGPVFGVGWTVGTALLAWAVLVLTCLATYLFGFAVSMLVLGFIELRNLVGAVVTAITTAISGAVVPVDFWPAGVRFVAHLLPATYGLDALHRLSREEITFTILSNAGLLVLVGVGWLGIGASLLAALVGLGRRRGTLEFP